MSNKISQRINPLFKASIFYIIGNGIGQGTILLGTIIFTRIMTQTDYGIYSTYYSIVSILTTLVGANLFIGLTNGYIDYAKNIHQFRASIMSLSTIVFLIFSTLILFSNAIIKTKIPVFLIVFALIHAYSFFVVNYYNYSANMENRYKEKTFFMVIPNVLQILFAVLFIFIITEYGLYARVIGSTLGVGICAGYVYFRMLKGKRKLINREYWSYAIKISIPSVLSSISYMLMQQCDNIMITKFYSPNETAVYSLVYNVGYILFAVLQATNGVWQTWLYHALDSDTLENAKKAQKWYLFVLAQMTFGLYMLAPELIKLLAPSTYWNFQYVAPFIIGSCLMAMYSFYTTMGNFYKKTGKVSMCVFSAAAVNVLLNYFFIPRFGGVAAAYTSVFSYLILFILSRNLGQKLNYGVFSGKYFLIFIFVAAIGGCVFLAIYPYALIRYGIYSTLLLISLLYMLSQKEEIVKLIKV